MRILKSILFAALAVLPISARAQSKAVMEGIPASSNTVFLSTPNAMLMVGTSSYTLGRSGVSLHVKNEASAGSLFVVGSATAAYFYGNGSGLTAVPVGSFSGGVISGETDFLSSATVHGQLGLKVVSSVTASAYLGSGVLLSGVALSTQLATTNANLNSEITSRGIQEAAIAASTTALSSSLGAIAVSTTSAGASLSSLAASTTSTNARLQAVAASTTSLAAEFGINPGTTTISGQDSNGYSLTVSSGISAQCISLQGGQVCGPGSGVTPFTGGVVSGASSFTATVNVTTITASGPYILQDGTSLYSSAQFTSAGTSSRLDQVAASTTTLSASTAAESVRLDSVAVSTTAGAASDAALSNSTVSLQSQISGISVASKGGFLSGTNQTLGVGTFLPGYTRQAVVLSSITVVITTSGSGGSSGTVWGCCYGGGCVTVTSSQGAAIGSIYNNGGGVVSVPAGGQIVLEIQSTGETITPTANVICGY